MLLSEAQLTEFLGFSHEEKVEKLKRELTDCLTRNKAKVDKVFVHDDNGDVKVSAYIKGLGTHDFGGTMGASVMYYPKDKYAVAYVNGKSVGEAEVKNTPASCICSLMLPIFRKARAKQLADKDESDRRYADWLNDRAKRHREITDKVDRQERAGFFKEFNPYNANGTPKAAPSEDLLRFSRRF